MNKSLTLFCYALAAIGAFGAPVSSVDALVAASAGAKAGEVIELAAGEFAITKPLEIQSGVALRGSGIGKTTLTHAATWTANPATLPDSEVDRKHFDTTGYLIHIAHKAKGVTISGLTLRGPNMHGAIYVNVAWEIDMHSLLVENFMYNGIRTFELNTSKIHDCTFKDVGMRWDKGKPGLKGGNTGGGIFTVYMKGCEIFNNRLLNTRNLNHEHYYGIKGREARQCRIHHNTIETNFSLEFPFEGDQDVEIDHNVLHGAVSIPKYAGGPVPPSGRTFHIHHNLFKDSYSIEFVRNGVEVSHNLFDFDAQKDHGNLIAAFGDKPAPGPASFHNNLVSNPGRGVMWLNEPYANMHVHHNHIIARPTKKPRVDGLFGFNGLSDFSTYRFEHNLVECIGQPRPFFRNEQSYAAVLVNNKLVNVTDAEKLKNSLTGALVGLEKPLKFVCGVNGEFGVDGWKVKAPKVP